MKYNLTEKLRFDEDPVLVIRDTELTVKSDAEIVLKMLDVLATKGEHAAAREVIELLLSEKDRKKLAALRLKIRDYSAVVRAAVALATGNDPEATEPAGE